MARKKALIIGINYYGTEHELAGCINDAMNVKDFLINDRGFPDSQHDMVVMTDAPENEGTILYPTGENMMAAFEWLTSYNQPGDVVWLSYSGHGGQVADTDGDAPTGFDDTICPVDFETNGQINSDTLHRAIVSPMDPRVRLTILFDCCHSGSACELPFVFRPDADGNVNLMDTFKKGAGLVRAAEHLLQGGFSMTKVNDAAMLLGGAADFFNSLHHLREGTAGEGGEVEDGGEVVADSEGLAEDGYAKEWETEGKDVWMFSGCADDQTSADTSIAGRATGAMSWAFIGTMREEPGQSYRNVLQNTRALLLDNYSQIPQLSCGGEYDLDEQLAL